MRILSILTVVVLALLLLPACCCTGCSTDSCCGSCDGACASSCGDSCASSCGDGCSCDGSAKGDAATCEVCAILKDGATGWCAECQKGFSEGQEVNCTTECAANPGGPPCPACVK